MKYNDTRLPASGDLEIYTQTWSPDSEPKAHVVIVHGYLEHSGRYAHLAEYLVTCGLSVTAFDCRGHGKSSGERAFVKDIAEYIADLELIMEYVLNRVSIPMFVLAHSNGGLAALYHYLGKQ